jgi:26S proteasome regulatory subunit N8
VIIDVRQGVVGLPTTAYEAVEEIEVGGKEIQRSFKHIPCAIEAEEAEEVSLSTLHQCIGSCRDISLAWHRSAWSIFCAISTTLPPAA